MQNNITSSNQKQQVVGLMPAGGLATRIAPLPCSKELYPIGFQQTSDQTNPRPKVVCQYLLENMKLAGADKAYIILRKGKWDIPAYLGDGTLLGMRLAYLIMNLPFGAPYTIDQAYPFVQDNVIVFGFPDIIFEPADAFARLLAQQSATGADVVLGLFPAENPHKMDMVDLHDDGRVRRLVIKPKETDLQYTWIIAVWTPPFTQFMHDYLLAAQKNTQEDLERKELFVGDVINAAIDNNLQVETVRFSNGKCLDIGTPTDLVRAVYNSSQAIS